MAPGVGGAYLYALWTDADRPEQSEEFAALDDFYSRVHLAEVLRENPGFETATRGARLRTGSPGGFEPPRWVALYGIGDRESADTYLIRARTGHRARYSSLTGVFPDALVGRERAVYRREEVVSHAEGTTGAIVLIRHEGQAEPPRTALGGRASRRSSRYRRLVDLSARQDAGAEWLDIHETDAATAAAAVEGQPTSPGSTATAYAVVATVTEPAKQEEDR